MKLHDDSLQYSLVSRTETKCLPASLPWCQTCAGIWSNPQWLQVQQADRRPALPQKLRNLMMTMLALMVLTLCSAAKKKKNVFINGFARNTERKRRQGIVVPCLSEVHWWVQKANYSSQLQDKWTELLVHNYHFYCVLGCSPKDQSKRSSVKNEWKCIYNGCHTHHHRWPWTTPCLSGGALENILVSYTSEQNSSA